ncbi:MAG: MlaE family lipid ABC transporter permease subunit [Burkholderiales bacterium]
MNSASPNPSHPTAATITSTDQPDGARTLAFTGRLDAVGTSSVWRAANEAARGGAGPLVIDATAVDYCDGAGIALLVALRDMTRSAPADVRGLKPQFDALLRAFEPGHFNAKPAKRVPARPLAERAGRLAASGLSATRDQITFLGQATAALAFAVRHPSSVRWRDALVAAERTGIDALPIVALIAFLMGVILAFQSAIPLRQFGGEIFVADLVGLSMLRELGPLMTAILLAGRTGAAFAAELGTMKVNDEINALSTMGIDPIRFLVVPRVLAALIATPLLTIFADMVGLLGGALTMLAFSIPTATYFNQLAGWVSIGDFFTGWVKAFVFGVLIAGIGCLKGLQARNDASAVGEATTSAVVASIVMIVVIDGLFAWLYYYLDV